MHSAGKQQHGSQVYPVASKGHQLPQHMKIKHLQRDHTAHNQAHSDQNSAHTTTTGECPTLTGLLILLGVYVRASIAASGSRPASMSKSTQRSTWPSRNIQMNATLCLPTAIELSSSFDRPSRSPCQQDTTAARMTRVRAQSIVMYQQQQGEISLGTLHLRMSDTVLGYVGTVSCWRHPLAAACSGQKVWQECVESVYGALSWAPSGKDGMTQQGSCDKGFYNIDSVDCPVVLSI